MRSIRRIIYAKSHEWVKIEGDGLIGIMIMPNIV